MKRMQLSRETVLSVLKQEGPRIPTQIKKTIGQGDTFMIGALLTELREAGHIKVSNTKRGGSPFYYVPEHSSRLVDLIPDLGEKERRAALLLKERKILRDDTQDPLIRVCLRSIKDFSVPVDVKINGEKILFWKWYQTNNQEAETLIKQLLGVKTQAPKEEPAPVAQTPKEPDTKAAAPVTQEPVKEKEVAKEEKQPQEPSKESHQATLKEVEDEDIQDDFYAQLRTYFAEKKIVVKEKDIKRKNSEIDLILQVPSAVGMMDYYCKAKNKKKNNDGDLSTAYLQGQGKKLPVLYITTGEVTKKAKDMLPNEFKGLILLEL